MRARIVIIAAAIALAGCANMSSNQKRVAWVAGGVIAIGALAAGGAGTPEEPLVFGVPQVPCRQQPDGSCR